MHTMSHVVWWFYVVIHLGWLGRNSGVQPNNRCSSVLLGGAFWPSVETTRRHSLHSNMNQNTPTDRHCHTPLKQKWPPTYLTQLTPKLLSSSLEVTPFALPALKPAPVGVDQNLGQARNGPRRNPTTPTRKDGAAEPSEGVRNGRGTDFGC